MRVRLAGGLDLVTGGLIVGGAALIAVSIVATVVLRAPQPDPGPTAPEVPTRVASSRPSIALPSDRVAALLHVEAATGAGGAVRPGDRVDVLGYFSAQVTGTEGLTRMLLPDVAVLTVERSGSSVALTLAIARDTALLLHEAQSLGARQFVTLRPYAAGDATRVWATFSDAELASRFVGAH
jgi:hypothetical protein